MNKPVQPDVSSDDIDFGDMRESLGLLLRLAQVRLFDGFYEKLGQYGLKPGEFTMLWLIFLNPGSRQGLIARRLRIKPAHMTKLVQRNVTKGFIKRVVPDGDRRSVQLFLTEEGQKFVQDHKPEFLNFIALENTLLGEEEFSTLIAILQKFNGMEVSK